MNDKDDKPIKRTAFDEAAPQILGHAPVKNIPNTRAKSETGQ